MIARDGYLGSASPERLVVCPGDREDALADGIRAVPLAAASRALP